MKVVEWADLKVEKKVEKKAVMKAVTSEYLMAALSVPL